MMHAHGISNDHVLARVVRKVDNAIRHNRVDSVVCMLTLIHWMAIYPVDSVIQSSNNLDLFNLARDIYFNWQC